MTRISRMGRPFSMVAIFSSLEAADHRYRMCRPSGTARRSAGVCSGRSGGGVQPRTSRSLRLVIPEGLNRASNRQGTRMLGSFPLPRKIRLLAHRARRTPVDRPGRRGSARRYPRSPMPRGGIPEVSPDRRPLVVDHVEGLGRRPWGCRSASAKAWAQLSTWVSGSRVEGPKTRWTVGRASGRGRRGTRCPGPR